MNVLRREVKCSSENLHTVEDPTIILIVTFLVKFSLNVNTIGIFPSSDKSKIKIFNNLSSIFYNQFSFAYKCLSMYIRNVTQ